MADFISREAVISEFCDDCMDKEWCKSNGESCSRIKNINAVPASDVRPVVRGKWEIDNSYAGQGLMNLRCSVCGEFGGTWRDCTLPSMLYKFCPNCGANMRPDKNDQRGEKNSG